MEDDLSLLLIEWQAAMIEREPRRIVTVSTQLAEEFSARGEPTSAVTALRWSLDAVGPSERSAPERELVASALIARQLAIDDLDGAWRTASRLVLAEGTEDAGWRYVHTVSMHVGMAQRAQEFADRFRWLESVFTNDDRPPWDAGDELAADPDRT